MRIINKVPEIKNKKKTTEKTVLKFVKYLSKFIYIKFEHHP